MHEKMKFEDLLTEDVTGGGGVLRPHPLTLIDLVGVASKIQQTEGDAPKTLPYPGEFILEELADLYFASAKLHKRLKDVRNNALVTSNKAACAKMDKLFISLSSIKKITKVIAKQLEGLTVDKLDSKD